MVNQPTTPPTSPEQLLHVFNHVGKISIGYTNGSTLTLEGDSLTSFVAFQRLLIAMFSTAVAAQTEEQQTSPESLTRTTLTDQLKYKKGQP